MEIKDRFKLLRKTLGFNQQELGKKIGLSQVGISFIETGTSVLTEGNIKLICALFNVNENWLRCGEGEMFDAVALSEREEITLRKLYKVLSPTAQELLVDYAKKLLADEEALKKKNEQ